jgi:hypothetical protein
MMKREFHTKSDRIRAAARSLAAQGKPPRPKEIVGILKKEGVHVLSSQVTTALRGTDLALTKGMAHWRPNPQPAPLKPRDIASRAEEFVRDAGSIEDAIAAIGALVQARREQEYYGGA